MNHGLLAPQFGVGRVDGPDPDRGQHPAAKDVWGTSHPGSGPTVTIKRRRLVEPSAVESTHPPSSAPVKAPKVFKLQVQATQSNLKVERSEPDAEPTPPAATTFRRRRDPSRKPTLVQHIVFEQPKAEPQAAVQLADQHENAAIPKLNSKKLRSALERLDEELRRSARCREAAGALDAHFKRLGF